MAPEPSPYIPPPAPYVSAPTKSNFGGKQHPDTQYFDDYTGALSGRTNFRITKLKVITDGKFVYGIESIYDADGMAVTAGSHIGREMAYGSTA
jgi:ketosteroid isomerase-like protein